MNAPARAAALQRLARRIDHDFADPGLLERAMTHRSAGRQNNERLEFLGDAVLGWVVADALYRRHEALSESRLTLARSELVRRETLAEIGRELDLADALRLGGGAARSGGHRRDSVLADAVEALIGALYLDAGEARARQLVLDLLGGRLEAVAQQSGSRMKDAKTLLQEFLQAGDGTRPEYLQGPVLGRDHAQRFRVVCRVPGAAGRPGLELDGEGRSRRAAEKAAAAAVLRALDLEGGHGH